MGAHQGCVDAQEKEEQRHHAVSMGMAADEDGNTKTFAEQLSDVRSSLTGLATEKEQAKMRIDHLKPTLQEKKAAAKGAAAEHAKMSKKLEATQVRLERRRRVDVADGYSPLAPASESESLRSLLPPRST